MTVNEIEYKIKSVMLGHAVGDALGVPVEFMSREELRGAPVTDMRGFGSYAVPAGSWSDDTSMSLCALDSLATGEIDCLEIMINFANWLEKDEFTPTGVCFDVGRTCLAAVKRFYEVACDGYEFSTPPGFFLEWCGQDGEYDNGNGSLMRIHPFVLYLYFDVEMKSESCDEIIDVASSLTHSHERSKLACRIYKEVLFSLLDSQKKESVKDTLDRAKEKYKESSEIASYARLLEDGFADLPEDDIKSSGYVVDTLEAALWCLLNTSSYSECVLRAANLGRDTDTVAAVAGGLAGALYGYDSIPKEWLETLKRRDYIEEMCSRAARNWHERPTELAE